jgi:NAD-dependent dihydropyrimidine dehydrogenase PreA subunit
MKTAMRKIVRIDEEKCDGCGDCVPSCAEGAIRIIDGKARLISETLCDGMGSCLGECPRGAITIEERDAADFDPAEVERRKTSAQGLHGLYCPYPPPEHATEAPKCPGSAPRSLRPAEPHASGSRKTPIRPRQPPTDEMEEEPQFEGRSRLAHWPVQLGLIPPTGPIWQDSHVLIAADCVPFAMAGFHERLLAGKSLAIACPKLDNMEPHVEKLARIFASNDIRSITVAHMEVPCCWGIARAVEVALKIANRTDIPVETVVIGVNGEITDRSS